VFEAGGYAPHTPEGRQLLVHEATHVVQQSYVRSAQLGTIQRVGIIESISRFFGGGTFSDAELKEYLKFITEHQKIEDHYDSDNKARAVVQRWKARNPGFAVLTVPVRVLLIQEMASGYLSDDDQRGILDLLHDSIASELVFILPRINIDKLRTRFDGDNRKKLDAILENQEIQAISLGEEWTVAGVKQILSRHGDQRVLKVITDQNYKIFRFTTAFEKWRYDDGHEEEEEMTGLKGITLPPDKKIGIRKVLNNQQASSTLFHELNHVISPVAEDLEQEVQVRVETEKFRIRHGMPPVKPQYRKPDGTIDEAFIRGEITGSQEYNPTGRQRVSIRFVGEEEVTGWAVP
jgi:hypothetical protein